MHTNTQRSVYQKLVTANVVINQNMPNNFGPSIISKPCRYEFQNSLSLSLSLSLSISSCTSVKHRHRPKQKHKNTFTFPFTYARNDRLRSKIRFSMFDVLSVISIAPYTIDLTHCQSSSYSYSHSLSLFLYPSQQMWILIQKRA